MKMKSTIRAGWLLTAVAAVGVAAACRSPEADKPPRKLIMDSIQPDQGRRQAVAAPVASPPPSAAAALKPPPPPRDGGGAAPRPTGGGAAGAAPSGGGGGGQGGSRAAQAGGGGGSGAGGQASVPQPSGTSDSRAGGSGSSGAGTGHTDPLGERSQRLDRPTAPLIIPGKPAGPQPPAPAEAQADTDDSDTDPALGKTPADSDADVARAKAPRAPEVDYGPLELDESRLEALPPARRAEVMRYFRAMRSAATTRPAGDAGEGQP